MHDTATHTISLLRTLDPGLDLRLEQQEAFCAIRLPAAHRGQYRFTLYVYDDGEPQICATLLEGDPEASFWYFPFEDPDYDSQSERENEYLEAVHELLTSPTRIRQTRGLLFTTFRCDVRRETGWSRIGPLASHLRWGTKPPPTSAKAVNYESPPLIDV